jgi:hypothetical protein
MLYPRIKKKKNQARAVAAQRNLKRYDDSI